MLLKNRLIAFGSACFLTASVVSSAQVTEIKPFRQIKIDAPVRIDTRTILPQIVESRLRVPKEAADNENTPKWANADPINTLPVGKVMNYPRLSVKGSFGSIGFTGYVPPDCDMSVGPNDIVTVVNTAIAFHDKKTGKKTFQQDLGQFFAKSGLVSTNLISDPKVIFDAVSQRWFVIILEIGFSTNEGKILFAVSNSSNPNGVWTQYRFDDTYSKSGVAYWLDYPGFATNKDTIVFTGNMFGFSNGFDGNQVIVMPKAPILAGGSTTATSFKATTGATMKAAVSQDPAVNAVYLMGDNDRSSISVGVVTNGATAPTYRQMALTVPTKSYPNGVIYGPGGSPVDGFGDSRIFTSRYKDGYLMGAHSIGVSTQDTRNCVRWYEVATNNWPFGSALPKLTQAGNVTASGSDNYHMPAIARNKFGDIALLFSKTGSSTMADVVVAGRTVRDAAGTMGLPQSVIASTGTYQGYRWGDYFAITVDPTDDKTFYGYGMTVPADGTWATHVITWTITESNPVTLTPTSATVNTGDYLSGSLNSLYNVDSDQYLITTTAVKGVGQVGALETTFNYSGDLTKVTGLTLNVSATGNNLGTEMIYLWNYSTNSYDWLKSVNMGPGATASFTVSSGISKYIGPGGAMKAMSRVVQPNVKGITPAAFRYGNDQIQMIVSLG